MQNLPTQSRASASKGLWFVFKDGQHLIRAWGSYWTGLERIYFDDALVMQSPNRAETFEFDRLGHTYQIQFCTQSVAIGQLRCTLIKDSKVLHSLRSKRRKIINVRPLTAHVVACVIFGLLAGSFNLPLWAGFTCIMLSFAITLLSNAKTDDFIIEETSSG